MVASRLDDPSVILIDARQAEEYTNGHIPGAINVDHLRNAAEVSTAQRTAEYLRSMFADVPVTSEKLWKSAGELRAMYADVGATSDKLVISYCTTGVRSAVTYFSLKLIGYPNVLLYPGSWNEWSAHPELPVTKGDQP